ncbi:hypothetical protein NB11A_05130 [Ligilactobacillus agilis]|nr:hypothetical protein NB11A_05130 [Ligilactobacillus agilis]
MNHRRFVALFFYDLNCYLIANLYKKDKKVLTKLLKAGMI